MICKYFLPFTGLSFVLFMVSFAVEKVFNLISSQLFIFISITLGDRSKKDIAAFYVKECSAYVFL